MNYLALFITLNIVSNLYENNPSEIMIYSQNKVKQLSSVTQPGDIILFESKNICSGCIKTMSPTVSKITKSQNIFLLTNESDSKSIRYRKNDWENYVNASVVPISYDSLSLSLFQPSPLIIIRTINGFEVIPYEKIFASSGRIIKCEERKLKKKIRHQIQLSKNRLYQ